MNVSWFRAGSSLFSQSLLPSFWHISCCTFLVVHFLLHIPCCIYPVVYFLMPPGILLICHQDGHNYLFKSSHPTCFFLFQSGHNLAMSLFIQVKVSVTQSCLTLWNPMDWMLKWVAIPFSREFFWPRDQAQISCIAGGVFTIWAT